MLVLKGIIGHVCSYLIHKYCHAFTRFNIQSEGSIL